MKIKSSKYKSIRLTKRQKEVADLLKEGNTVDEIADMLRLSKRTVQSYINGIARIEKKKKILNSALGVFMPVLESDFLSDPYIL